jgi:hypothetical protein
VDILSTAVDHREGPRLTLQSQESVRGPPSILIFPVNASKVGDRPQNPHGESVQAVHVRRMGDITCGRYFFTPHTRLAAGQLLEITQISHTNAHFWRPKCPHRRLPAVPQRTPWCRWVHTMWEGTPDTSDRSLKVGTRYSASRLPAKSSVFLRFPIQNGN